MAKVLTDRDAAADLAGTPRPDNVPDGGRVTVERMCRVSVDRGSYGSNTLDAVRFSCAQESGDGVVCLPDSVERRYMVTIAVRHGETTVRLSMDDLLATVAALCPPWLLRNLLVQK